MPRFFLLYKPYGVLSQFTKEAPGHRTLTDLYDFPPGIYPVGRLDKDSEGLLILTDDNELKHRLLTPKYGHKRAYFVQVEGIPEEEPLERLRRGVVIRIEKKDYKTLPAEVRLLPHPPDLPDRAPPVRYRKTVPDSWLEIELTEGKNRQVRRMCAEVGFPVLRLVRVRIGGLSLGNLRAGEVKEIRREDIDL
jgi:23S rRNA pseudouridine2457 synthase